MKNHGSIRYIIQCLGILLVVIGFFSNYPIANSILLGTIIMIGPVFCGWICPFGTLQDILSNIGDKLGIKKYVMPTIVKRILFFSRYILLLVTILISTDLIFNIMSLDPRANFTTFLEGKSLTLIGWIVIFIFLVSSVFFERPFCNYLCIEGAKFGLLSIIRPFTIIRNKENCIGCNKCNLVCPMNIDVASHGQVRSPQCINCIKCVDACPAKNTLNIRLLPGKKILRKVVLVSAVVVFLAVVYTGTNSNSLFKGIERNYSTSSSVMTEDIATEYGDASGIEDGIYDGTGTGFKGEMTVEVTVKDEQITAINVVENNDDAKWFNRAYSTVSSNIITNQTADVDSVSGATYSSMGIKEAVANALINAGGKNVKAIVNDLPEAHNRR